MSLQDPRDVVGDPTRECRGIRVRFDGVAPRVQLVALLVVDARAADPRLAIVVFLGRWRCSLVRLGSRRRARGRRIRGLAHPHRHSIEPGAHRGYFGRDDVGVTRDLFEIAHLVRDLDAHRGRVLREERAAGRDQPRGAERPFDAAATPIRAQLADDAGHVRRHVLDDPDAQLDRLDRRTVVHADLAVQRLLDVVAAPPTVIGRRRRLLQLAISPLFDLDLLVGRDDFAKILVRVEPQRIAGKRCRGISSLLVRRVGSEACSNIPPDLLHEPSRDLVDNSHWRLTHDYSSPGVASSLDSAASTSWVIAAATSRLSSNVEFGPHRARTSRATRAASSRAAGSTTRGAGRFAIGSEPDPPARHSQGGEKTRSGSDPPWARSMSTT